MRLFTLLLALLLSTGLLFAVEGTRAVDASATPAKSTATTPAEEKLGAKVAEAIEKDYKLVTDETQLQRLKTIAATLAPLSERPDVVYTCKIIDSPELNAMAIPGGTIYITSTLLAAVESDHELAGVLAHEIAHNALYHSEKSVRRDTRMTMGQIALILVLMGTKNDHDIPTGDLITMSELVKQALANGYGVDLEYEADQHGTEYLLKSNKYDPVGLYSVILGFNQMESRRPERELGFLKTHPKAIERKKALETQLHKAGASINLWRVVDFRARVIDPAEGEKGYGLQLGSTRLITLSATVGDADAKTRATDAANTINRRLTTADPAIDSLDIDVDERDGVAAIRLRRITVLSLTPADADAAGMTLETLGKSVVQHLKEAFWQEKVKRS